MLFLHELKQVLVLGKQFSFINRNVSIKQILLTCIVFPWCRNPCWGLGCCQA